MDSNQYISAKNVSIKFLYVCGLFVFVFLFSFSFTYAQQEDSSRVIPAGSAIIKEKIDIQKTRAVNTANNLQEKRLEAVENSQNKRENLKDRAENVRENLSDKKQNTQERVEVKRAAITKKLNEKARERINAYTERIVRRLNAAIERLEKLALRLESRIEKLEERFKDRALDLSNAKKLLVGAREEINLAKTNISTLMGLVDETLNNTENPRKEFGKVQELIKNTVSTVKDAHRALVEAIKAVKAGINDTKPAPTGNDESKIETTSENLIDSDEEGQ